MSLKGSDENFCDHMSKKRFAEQLHLCNRMLKYNIAEQIFSHHAERRGVFFLLLSRPMDTNEDVEIVQGAYEFSGHWMMMVQ